MCRRGELDQVRRRGYAASLDQLEDGLAAIAAPVRSAHGDVVLNFAVGAHP